MPELPLASPLLRAVLLAQARFPEAGLSHCHLLLKASRASVTNELFCIAAINLSGCHPKALCLFFKVKP